MNKLTIMSLFSVFFMALFAVSAAAAVTVNYNFYDINTTQPLNNVDVLGYPCRDAGCNALKLNSPLAGSGNSGAASMLSLVYPTSLANQYGYAVYYFRPGYAPQEYNSDWRGNGQTRYSIPFNRMSYCSANISDIDVDVDNQTGEAVFNFSVMSAFSDPHNRVGYVPPAYINYYSALTSVNVTIYDEQDNAVSNWNFMRNIFMSTSDDVGFSAVLQPGNYTAVVSTDVNDDQCASGLERQRQIDFEMPETPIAPLNVTLTADPINGTEPLNVSLNCSVQGGVAPYNYSFFDDNVLFFNTQIRSNSISINRTFSAGNHTVTCSVSDSDGRNDSDSVLIIVNAIQVPECRDGIDNDGDVFIDYPADPGCENPDDDNETDIITPPECSDLIDNDGDGFIDYPADPGCINAADDNESDTPNVCENHLNISNVLMNNLNLAELNTYPVNNFDVFNGYIPFDYYFTNTGDSAINASSYATTMINQQTGSVSYHASILPNLASYSTFIEGDNLNLPFDLTNGTYNMTIAVTGNDTYGCYQYDEFIFFLAVNTSGNQTYDCSDLIDNDGDGFIDYPADPGCINATDDDEYNNITTNEAPLVTLLFPPDNSSFSIGNLIFIYGVVDDHSPLLSCTFYSNITGAFAPMQSQVTANGGIGFFNVSGIPDGTYIWNVQCSDGLLSAFAPSNWTFTVDTTGYVDMPADVNITADPSTGNAPLNVQFNSSVTGNFPIIYSWTFGDGAASNLPNPQHTYQNAGIYTAALTITDADGDTASDSVLITVTSSGGDSDGDDEEEDHEAEYDLYIGRIKIYSDMQKNYGEEYVGAGEELYVDTFFENLGSKDLENIEYRVMIPDLGIMNAAKFDLDSGDHVTMRVVLDIPEDALPGDYDVQISASNDEIRRVKYRFVTVLE